MPTYILVAGDFTRLGGMDRANLALARYLAVTENVVTLVTHRADAELTCYPNVALQQVVRPWGRHQLGAPWLDRRARQCAQTAPAGTRVVSNGGNCLWGDVNWVHFVHAAAVANAASQPTNLYRRWQQHHDRRREQLAVRAARLVIANSERTRRDLIAHVGVSPERIQVVYYGSDPKEFYPPAPQEPAALRQELGLTAERPLVGFIGALGDGRKGFDTLFDVWGRFGAATGAMLLVIGSGSCLPQWRARAREQGLDSHLRFLGFRADVPRLMRMLDLVVAPTRYEAYGLAVHEAWCCDVPAMVSRQAGVAERCPDSLQELLLQDPNHAGELEQRLWAWWRNRTAFLLATRELGAKLRAITWDDMAREMVNAITAAPPAA